MTSRSATRSLRGLPPFVVVLLIACGPSTQPESKPAANPAKPPSILIVTLDTTRADSIGPEAAGITTPAFNRFAARGRRFRQAYATVPETLPSHTSMMTGLYPAGHGVHENARTVSKDHVLLAERLHEAGYRTAAFVSSFVLARRFGLGRGFDVYDDDMPQGRAERDSEETTRRAVEFLKQAASPPTLMWVHYYDPHVPYAPPEPFRTRFAKNPYLGEIAAMDLQLGKLVEAFERSASQPAAVIVVADHGEGLGDHGEPQHGTLVHQSTMHVPLVLLGPGVTPGVSDEPVSTRRIFHTVLDWAGISATNSLRGPGAEVVLGEGMKPFLEYGWQPQVMSVEGRFKVIQTNRLEAYDVIADPGESMDIAREANLSRGQRNAIRDYPIPSAEAARAPSALSDEDRRKLASLGYVSAGAAPVVRKDAPRPSDMTPLLDAIERASTLFVQEQYEKVIPVLESILAKDAFNLDATLRLATAHSAVGHDDAAVKLFEAARALAPASPDVRAYLALHYARGKDWREATPLLERVIAETPDRLPALEALATIRVREDGLSDALSLRQRVYALRAPTSRELVELGQLAMRVENTTAAIDAFEGARRLQGPAFRQDLELGVLYLAARRFEDARDALDRVSPRHPAFPMALFKRAQVSVLLKEADQAARIEAAKRRADATTRELIARERLFPANHR